MKVRVLRYDLITVEPMPILRNERYKVYPGLYREIDFRILQKDYELNHGILLRSSAQLEKKV